MKPSSKKPVSVSTYLLMSGISLLAAVGIGYYYLHNLVRSSNRQLDDRIYYLVLILFGIAVSALIFGIMNSYAALKGVQSGATYKFTGPVVGVILTVLGGFLVPKDSTDQFLSVRIINEDKNPVTRGSVTLTFPHYQRAGSVNEKGMVVFPDIPFDQLRSGISINVESDGYAPLNIDTLLPDFKPVTLTVTQSKIIRLSGTVTDAADRPIRDVEVAVDGTPYSAHTINNGSFQIPIPDYHFGDHITLVTSHPDYEDKAKDFVIESGAINKIEFVLNPVPVSSNSKRTKK